MFVFLITTKYFLTCTKQAEPVTVPLLQRRKMKLMDPGQQHPPGNLLEMQMIHPTLDLLSQKVGEPGTSHLC